MEEEVKLKLKLELIVEYDIDEAACETEPARLANRIEDDLAKLPSWLSREGLFTDDYPAATVDAHYCLVTKI